MKTTTEEAARISALAEHLEADADDVSACAYGEHQYDCQGEEWLVLTDEEADEAALEQVRETAWAFRSEFLASHTPDGIGAEEIDAIRGDRCEGVNDAILALIEAGSGFEHFAADAIGCDGRGHFLAGHDFEEHEAGGFYLYRVN